MVYLKWEVLPIFTIELMIVFPIIVLIICGFLIGTVYILQEAEICEAYTFGRNYAVIANVEVNEVIEREEILKQGVEKHVYGVKILGYEFSELNLQKNHIDRKVLMEFKQVIHGIQ